MRNLGLDIARSAAIIMVLISHSRFFFTQYTDLQFLSFNGLLGVELFFVLSGFLIGGILLRDLYEEGGSLMRFYSRRWLRTLPAYFLVLSVLLVVAVANQEPWFLQHYLFIQNFNYEQMSFFPVSWSLSIEEWFYLLSAPLLLMISKISGKHKKEWFFAFCLLVIAGSIIAKVLHVYWNNPPWDAGVRKQIFFRMDSFIFGIGLAGIKHYYQSFYEKVKASHLFVLSISMLALIVAYYVGSLEAGKEAINHSFIGRTILFDAISFSFMLMIWALEKSKRVNSIQGIVRKSALYVALLSYSLYLVHFEIFFFVIDKTTANTSVYLQALFLLLSVGCSFILAHIIYKYWELPFIKMRERKKSIQR